MRGHLGKVEGVQAMLCYLRDVWPIYVASNLAEAELLRHRLSEQGIASTVRNGFLQGAIGELPATLLPEVCVASERDVSVARDLVAEMEQRQRAPEGFERACPRCREMNPANFELCWSCREEIPDKPAIEGD